MNELDPSSRAARSKVSLPAPPRRPIWKTPRPVPGQVRPHDRADEGHGALSVDEKKTRGAAINLAKQAIEAALTARRQALADAELQAQLQGRGAGRDAAGPPARAGRPAPGVADAGAHRGIFGSMGFDVAEGPEIETDWFNFTALNTPKTIRRARCTTPSIRHEGRTAPNLLRTHTSPMQIRYAVQHVKRYKPPRRWTRARAMPEIRVIAPGRTYRVDSDATHSPMFHQCEGLWMGENVSFKDLKVVFTDFCRTFFESDDLVLRFRPSFFPFTEPSAEIDIQFPSGPLAGRWLEVAGSGQVHPNVVRNMGLDPERYIGFAFGMGPDRLTMLRYGVNDLRLFFDGDLRFLSWMWVSQSC
jgi:phenylalanyl-tRNA synthetase alpha chain